LLHGEKTGPFTAERPTPLELSCTALRDKRSRGREYRTRNSFSTPVK
jgi:hypothetical protein